MSSNAYSLQLFGILDKFAKYWYVLELLDIDGEDVLNLVICQFGKFFLSFLDQAMLAF